VSRKGTRPGGKISTPIREMLDSDIYNGVVFHCEDPEHAEATRISALVARQRDRALFRTSRMGNDLVVYTSEPELLYGGLNPIHVNLERTSRHEQAF